MSKPRNLFALGLLLVPVLGCVANPLVKRLTLPDRYVITQQQLMVHSDFPLPTHHRTLDDLSMLRADLFRQLALQASDEPIHVYLFETSDRFNGFMKLYHPEFPERRAFFVETDTRLSVYVQWGDRVAEDLRHEATHGYLHSVMPNLPLWLDEGLAKYAEAPRGQRGVNPSLMERLTQQMRRNDWQPNLRRLEDMPTSHEMNQDDYAEAWAWVHFLLETTPDRAAVLRAYLAELKRDGTAPPILPRLQRLESAPERALFDHLASLGAAQKVL